jgi:NitT/TauT family transport system substrate-binding protein
MRTPSFPSSSVRLAKIVLAGSLALAATAIHAATTISIGIGTQHATINTVTGGIVLKELGLLDKHLPKTGKYQDVKYEISWQNSSSAPPITNGMMANNIQIAMMGDFPLLVNGATGQQTKNDTQFIAVIAYNPFGSGNGIVVHKDSPYYDISDLKDKKVSVPFGSSAHGIASRLLEPDLTIARGRRHQSAGKED